MFRFIRYISPERTVYICSNGKCYTSSEILASETLHQKYLKSYLKSELREIHENNLDGKKFDNVLNIIFNPAAKKEHEELFPQAYDDAFNQLWEVSGEPYAG